MTRILMTADTIGGVWQYAIELAEALKPHGVETTIAVLGPLNPLPSGERDRRVTRQGEGPTRVSEEYRPSPCGSAAVPLPWREREVEIISTNLPLDWLCDSSEPVLTAGAAIAQLAGDLEADLVHLNSPALAAGAAFDRPVVAVAHGCVGTWWRAARGAAPDPAYAWHGDLMRSGLAAADVAVAPSAAFAAQLQLAYDLPAPPLVVHNGRTPLPLPADAPPSDAVFTAGRLWDEVKGTALLDHTAARLSTPFRAAGPITGPHGETVATEHLHLLGVLDEAALAREYAGRPVYVSAAKFEPFGLSVLEAAQAGCPLVLSGIDTFRELWTGAALIVPEQDEAAYAEAIGRVLADPQLRAHLSKAARLRAARYTPDVMASSMTAIYASLLAEPQRVAA